MQSQIGGTARESFGKGTSQWRSQGGGGGDFKLVHDSIKPLVSLQDSIKPLHSEPEQSEGERSEAEDCSPPSQTGFRQIW